MRTKAAVIGLLPTLSTALATAAPYEVVTVAGGFDFPRCLAVLPDGLFAWSPFGG